MTQNRLTRCLPAVLAAGALTLAAAAPAGAASVAYVDKDEIWLSSPDGAHKVQLTQGGSSDAPWQTPAQGHDGKTVAVHRDTFEDGSKRPVLYRYGADGKQDKANVMPVYSGATVPVYPIGLDMDPSSSVVAYGYSYCGFACNTVHRGYWLTFSDHQGAYPSNPQGQGDAYFPTFHGRRVVSSDSGGTIFVQPDVAEAPFTKSYQSWLHSDTLRFSRAAVSPAGNQVAIQWSARTGSGDGIGVGAPKGAIPGDVDQLCDLPVAAGAGHPSYSPDGSLIAWSDSEGVKVAGAPNLAAGTATCTLTSPPVLISATGKTPDLGGADVAAILGVKAPPPAAVPAPTAGAPASGPGAAPGTAKPGAMTLKLSGKATRAAFAKGLTLDVQALGAGRIDASATVSAKDARRLRLSRRAKGASVARADVRGFAAARAVVVARGRANAERPGAVKLRLKPTKAAKRAARRMRGITLTVRVSQGARSGATRLKLR
jgi:hypothetical protein